MGSETYSLKVDGKKVRIHRNEVGNPVAKIGMAVAQGDDWNAETISRIAREVVDEDAKTQADAVARVTAVQEAQVALNA